MKKRICTFAIVSRNATSRWIRIATTLFTITGAILIHTAKAQPTSFTLTPASGTVDTLIPQSGLIIFDIFMENVSAGPLTLAYTQLQQSVAPGWYTSMCDLGTCYPLLPTQDTMDTVDPSESGFMGLNVDPAGYAGTTTISYYVYNAANPADGDTITWIIRAGTATATAPIASTPGLFIHPNPANHDLHINLPVAKGNTTYAIHDLSGKTIGQGTLQQGETTLPMDALPAGCYLLKIQDARHTLLTQRFMVRH